MGMPSRTVLTAAHLVVLSAGGLAAAGSRVPIAPHDVGEGRETRAYWLQRNREALATRRGAIPVGPAPALRADKLKFRKLRRLSHDPLGASPADLPTAQAETQTEPFVAVNPSNPEHLVAAWQESRFGDGGARALGVAVSRNGGRRWTEQLLPGLAVADGGRWNRASDPWVAFGPDGVVYASSLLVEGTIPGQSAIGVSVSTDGGSSWRPPVEVVRDDVDFNDKESITADTQERSPFRGTAYVAWGVTLISERRGQQRIDVARSTDEGATWSSPVAISERDTNIGIVLRVGPDGTVYAVWTGSADDEANLALLFARSSDGGRTFTEEREIGDYLAVGAPGFRSGAILPSFDVDSVTGDLYVAWPDARFTGVDQAAVIVSRDGGDTWSAPVRVSSGPDDVAAMTVGISTNGAGELVVGYYRQVSSRAGGPRVEYVVQRSDDGGDSFERAVAVTRKPFDAADAALSGQDPALLFLGDYVGLAGTRNGFVAVFTAVTKRSVLGPGRQPDVFAMIGR